MRWLPSLLVAMFEMACAGGTANESHPGPPLPTCERDASAAAGCQATWTGSDTGSKACTIFVTNDSGEWDLWLQSGEGYPLLNGSIVVAAAPNAGQSVTLDQTASATVQLTVNPRAAWEALKNRDSERARSGDLLLRLDQAGLGSSNVHGTLAASLAPSGEGIPGPGVALCVSF